MNTPAARLEGKLALVRPALQNAAQRLWTEKDAREIYTLYLEQMHMVVRSGVSLMETASLMANKLPCTFTKKMDLISYLDKHIEEERGMINGCWRITKPLAATRSTCCQKFLPAMWPIWPGRNITGSFTTTR